MANGLTVRQAESVRLMIDATKLVNRLQDYVHSSDDDDSKDMPVGKITAAKILLDKALPSLQSADITAHSAPVIESQEALMAKLAALIQSNPNLISMLAQHNQPKAIAETVEADSVAQNTHAAPLTTDPDASEGVSQR